LDQTCHFPANLSEAVVHTLQATVFGQADPFLDTQWSVILAAGESRIDAEMSRAALAQLCQTYWPPLYTYARTRGYSRHDAQDLTQGFFGYLIEHKIYTRTDRRKGKFRSFLLACFKNFLSDSWDRDQTLKRGGAFELVPLDEAKAVAAESFVSAQSFQQDHRLSEDLLFERSWAETLVGTVLDRVAASYKSEGKERLFQELQVFLTMGADPLPTYADLGSRLAITESTLRSHVTRLRARYREVLRAEVRRTVNDEADVDAELRELLRVLSGA
jgi:RNA polymerase sigma-70 factor (ECF subfamily)